jgi:hypothetical protein
MLLGLALACLITWLVPVLRDAAVAHGQIVELMRVVRSFASRAAVSLVLVLASWLLIRRLPFSLPACTMVLAAWAAWDLSSAGRVLRFTAPVVSSSWSPIYRHPADPLTPNDPLSIAVGALEGTDPYRGGSWRMEAIGGEMGASQPILLGLADAQGYNPVKLKSYADVFGAQKLMDEPKRFTLVAPGYDSVPYRWIGLRCTVTSSRIQTNLASMAAN